MLDMDKFDALQISIASPEKIRSWSYGEVKKPETINYRTHKPERDGLFCERIFGPQKDYECFCGKYKSIRYKGIVCERCNVEITKSSVRRERMGHIQLVTPVGHIWYSKGSPNYIALLLDISARDLEKVLYFQSYIVIDPGNLPLSKKQLLPEEGIGGEMGYRELREKYGEMFTAKMGAEAIKELLAEIDLPKLGRELQEQLKTATGTKKTHILKRMELVKMFTNSISRPEWMILDVIPVIPPDLRPMVQLDGGRFATSDLNDLYRRVINRNNRLKRLIKLQAPDIIVKNEKRMLQEAVNALIDNGRRGKLVTGPSQRPLKSLTDMLKGKQGRFRQNLLGKRVDYSGRSVIVVGPKLKMNQCGLPKKMALELFKPFVMHRLQQKGLATNIKSAKRMIEHEKNEVWDVLEEVIKHHPILLNRAPTLHRLGIQAFEPVLIEGKAIRIHPLVCTAFNADFDGDQMAVHVPLMLDAQVEARMLMMACNNILKPASGEPICTPTQDMTIGLFYLTIMKPEGADYPTRTFTLTEGVTWKDILLAEGRPCNFKLAEEINEKLPRWTEIDSDDVVKLIEKAKVTTVKVYKPQVFASIEEARNAYDTKKFNLQYPIYMKKELFVMDDKNKDKNSSVRDHYFKTTIGRVIFNDNLPETYRFRNEQIKKGTVSGLIKDLFNRYPLDVVGQSLDKLKALGYRYATICGLTISIKDMIEPPKKREILDQADKKVAKIRERWEKNEITTDERKQAEVDIWTKTTEDVTDDLVQRFESTRDTGEYNSIYMMAYSGARGNMQQMRQLAAMRGLMSNPRGDILAFPIKSNFREGLNQSEYFISTYGARKGLVDTALRTADSGYLTRRLVDVSHDVVVTCEDCGSDLGVEVSPIRQNRTSNNIMIDDIMVPISARLSGRVLARPIVHPETNETLVVDVDGEDVKLDANTYCTDAIAKAIEENCEFTLPYNKLKAGMICAEQIIDPKSNRLILRPDRPLNDYVLSKMKECGFTECKVRSKILMRSPLTCRSKVGICQACYGSDLATNKKVDIGESVGIIAAQSIGEPGTQLTMRTFHLGGVALAQRSYIKSRSTGVASFEALKLAKVSDRSKFEIGSGQETFDKTEFGATLKTVVVGGSLIVKSSTGKKNKVHIPVGAEMKIEPGAKVSPGSPLAEYNPNNIVTGWTGEVIFDGIEMKDGMVVSENGIIKILTQEFDPVTKDFIIEDYKIPQGAVLRVEDTEIVHAGNLIAEISAQSHAAISRMEGIAKFENVKIKNQQVISDNGIVFIFPTDDSEGKCAEYLLPKGVKEPKEATVKTNGLILNVKNGDSVFPGQKLLSILSETSGTASVSSNGTKISITRDVEEEFELKGVMSAKVNEAEKTLDFIAPISGLVKVISEKSTANKTLDRKRVIIKNEIEYDVPRGVILRPKENCKIVNGGDVEQDGDLTTSLVIQAEIDGTVELTKVRSEVRISLIDNVELVKGATLARALVNRETDEVYADAGKVVDDTLYGIVEENRYSIRDAYILKGEQDAVNVVGEDGKKVQYPVPEGSTIVVGNGDLVKIGDKLVTDIAPMKSEIEGKVNYIYVYNKIICEEIIDKILVYNGVEFSYPSALTLKFPPSVVKGEELTLAPIPFKSCSKFEETDGSEGIRICKNVIHEKKYALPKEMVASGSLLIEDGQDVREDQVIAVLKSENKGVVLLDHDISKEGKLKSTIKSIIVQPGESHQILDGAELKIEDGAHVKKGEILAKWGASGKKTTDIVQGLPRVAELFEVRRPKKEAVISEESGVVHITGNSVSIIDPTTGLEKPVRASIGSNGIVVHDGEYIEAGDPITDGSVFSKKLVKVVDLPVVRRYLMDEIQRVYRDQGVKINDKHVEIIVRQMLRKVTITESGDSEFLPSESVHVRRFEDKVKKLVEKGKKPPVGVPMIQGITKASLTTDSFISAASFQETTRVLTKAAIKSKVDYLKGLKENLIIGKLIPAGTGLAVNREFNYKNLPVEEEKTDDTLEDLFSSVGEAENNDLNDLESELFMTKPSDVVPESATDDADDSDDENDDEE